ncbi:MAG: hypothetical protein WAM60_13245 [Candidatus Promineifilaceae bacterium]
MNHKPSKHYATIVIPLNRDDIVQFLLPPSRKPKGAKIQIVGQRPSPNAESAWIEQIRQSADPTLEQFLTIDNPTNNLHKTVTDRLVPLEFLAKPEFLTRNLGGWNPNYFGVARLPASLPPRLAAKFPAQLAHDPLLRNLEVLRDYGRTIKYLGADPAQVATRLETELDCDWPTFVSSLRYLHSLRPQPQSKRERIQARTTYIRRLFEETVSGSRLKTADHPPIPKILLYDELLSQMRLLELARRQYLFAGKSWHALTIQNWQESWRQETGTVMIVKGEYIAGRHRGSLVLIAPELGVVIKQPAPEPFHEIELSTKTVNGRSENWPYLTHDGSLVTPRGRIRLLLEEGFIPRLHQIFQHNMTFSTLMGYTQEAFVSGQTVQQAVLAGPEQMTADLYDTFILHQQTCEALGVENGDWHSANFVIKDSDGEIVHVDWGAARPLRPNERTPDGIKTRLNQVQNIAYSFHNETLARRIQKLHTDLLADKQRLEKIRQKAQDLAR